MKTIIVLLAFSLSILARADWRDELLGFARQHVVHPAWGFEHSERNYHVTTYLARLEGIAFDEEVLFAAAYLHDLGGLPGYEVEGVDHGVRSAELAAPLLKGWGFPDSKIAQVQEVIRGHIYYGPQPGSALAQAFRDADMLDFLGALGIARLLAASSDLSNPPSISASVKVVQEMAHDLPARMSLRTSQELSKAKVQTGEAFLEQLEGEASLGKN